MTQSAESQTFLPLFTIAFDWRNAVLLDYVRQQHVTFYTWLITFLVNEHF